MPATLDDLRILQQAEHIADGLWKRVVRWDGFSRDVVGKQLARAADSVGANIAESFGRYHFSEKLQFLYYARGSIFETKYWVNRALARELLAQDEGGACSRELGALARQLNAFASGLKTARAAEPPKTRPSSRRPSPSGPASPDAGNPSPANSSPANSGPANSGPANSGPANSEAAALREPPGPYAAGPANPAAPAAPPLDPADPDNGDPHASNPDAAALRESLGPYAANPDTVNPDAASLANPAAPAAPPLDPADPDNGDLTLFTPADLAWLDSQPGLTTHS